MHSSAGSEPRPRVVRLPRLAAASLAVVVLPLTLAACGMFGGDSNAKAPVVIPSLSDAASPTDGVSPTDSVSPTSQESAAPAPPPGTVNNTVTRTGYLERTRTATKNFTATKNVTLPQITITNTVTDTKTVTQSAPGATVTVSGPTVFVTRPCLVPPCV